MGKFVEIDGEVAVVAVKGQNENMILFPSFFYFKNQDEVTCFCCREAIKDGDRVWFSLDLDKEHHIHDACIERGDPSG